MAYLIDTYNDWDQWDRTHSIYVFTVNDSQYAIKAVEMEWGLPKLPLRIDQEIAPEIYQLYETKEEAMAFVKLIKSLN